MLTNTDEIMERVRVMPWRDVRALADASGIPFPTLSKIRYQETRNPRAQTIDRLRDAIEAMDRERAAAAPVEYAG